MTDEFKIIGILKRIEKKIDLLSKNKTGQYENNVSEQRSDTKIINGKEYRWVDGSGWLRIVKPGDELQ